ncbi:NADH-quinone oxidoreductase subunit C [Aeromicrobium sp. UC242_57]|uniref:NADH-quinone oxidoreductase subunit C n=1 Tax=Aeromicrobium sp. UC242_57 TaxID=3374624 RepID=UPI003795F669
MSIADNAFGPPHRVVEAVEWHDAVAALKADGYTYFDWLSAVDEHPEGFRLVLHLARLAPLDHLLLVTYVDRESPAVASITDVFAGAAWHERETHEMFGIDFPSTGDTHLVPLLLPDGFEGHPLRKEFVLASRVAKPWPGGKEPGESDADSTHSPSRRRVKPPGVPDDWLQPRGGSDE